MTQLIVSLCGVIFLLYWAVSAPFVKQTKTIQKRFLSVRYTIVGLFVIFWLLNFWGILAPFPFLDRRIIPNTVLTQFFSALCAIVGTTIAIIARKSLGSNWSGNVELKKSQTLKTSGIYGYMRHPIYTGGILLMLGVMLLVQTTFAVILFLLVVSFLLYKLSEEEKLLTKYFPKEYSSYRKRTKTLIPFIW